METDEYYTLRSNSKNDDRESNDKMYVKVENFNYRKKIISKEEEEMTKGKEKWSKKWEGNNK